MTAATPSPGLAAPAPSGWAIRRAGSDDSGALALVGAATFLESYAGELRGADILAHCAARHAAAVYAGGLARDWCVWLGQAPRGAPVGYAVLAAPDIPQALPGDLELLRIYTLSRWHGSGLGPALLAAAVEEARGRGAPRLLLGAYARNHRALAFYRRSGFEVVGQRSFTVGGATYDDDVVMARALTDPAQVTGGSDPRAGAAAG